MTIATVQSLRTYNEYGCYSIEGALTMAENLQAKYDPTNKAVVYVIKLHHTNGWIEQCPADLARDYCRLHGYTPNPDILQLSQEYAYA